MKGFVSGALAVILLGGAFPQGAGSSDGWQLGNPDLVVSPSRPYAIRSGRTEMSRVFVFPVAVPGVRYVRAVEFRPGHPNAVRQATIRVDRTPASRELEIADPEPGYEGLILHSATYPDGVSLGWSLGQVAPLMPPGWSWRLEPGTDLVVELHLVPNGKSGIVAPSVGLYFTDDPPGRTPATLRLGRQGVDVIPGETETVSTDSFVLPVDVEVHAVQPHAHTRAREMRATATLPDGTTTSILSIEHWDFTSQQTYRFVQPLALPKGTTLAMRYTADNQAGRPSTTERTITRAQFGQRWQEEPGDLSIQVLTRTAGDLQTLTDAFQPKIVAEDIARYEQMLRRQRSRVLHDGAAELYLDLGRANEAVSHFRASLKLQPESAASQFNVGAALTIAGRSNEAVGYYQRALALRPDYTLAHTNLGNLLMQLGHPVEAAAHFRQAVQLKPDWPVAVRTLAWLLATAPDEALRDAAHAVSLGERAADLTGRQEAEALDVLAAAYAAAGQFDKAIITSQAALDLNPETALSDDILRRQALYKQRKAYRLPR